MNIHPLRSESMPNHSLSVPTIFGPMLIEEPVLKDLIASKAMQRLKKIHQFGVSHYVQTPYDFTRYDHSVGVLYLVRFAQAPLAEQIAGLLHDVSHTIFSHVGDVVFAHKDASSYQDDIHEWYLNNTDIPEVLARHGFSVQQILHKNKEFTALERDLPELCADRLEYILHEAVLSKLITQEQLRHVMRGLHFANGTWYCTDADAARHIGRISLHLTEFHFAAPWNVISYQWAGDMLRYALEHSIISREEMHFSSDDIIWHRLVQHTDSHIKQCMKKIMSCTHEYTAVDPQHPGAVHVRTKFRGVNPLVQIDGALMRLTEIDAEFKKEFERVKALMNQGLYVKL